MCQPALNHSCFFAKGTDNLSNPFQLVHPAPSGPVSPAVYSSHSGPSSVSHAQRSSGSYSPEEFHILWRTFHSSNIIFLMWSLAASQILPAQTGLSLHRRRCLTYSLSSWQAGPRASPSEAPEKGGSCQAWDGVCLDSQTAERRGSCDSVFVKC